jgi:hypothetical protein
MRTGEHQRCWGTGIALFVFCVFCDVALAQSYPGHWTGKWIWIEGDPKPYHFFLMARGDVPLDAVPAGARLHITAADRYMLYLNGQFLGRGPARSDPRWMSYDTYDVTSRLRAGNSGIAILAYHYGGSNNYTRGARAGLLAQLEISRADGSKQIIGTDHNWRVRQAMGWRRDVDWINISVGATEFYDANQDPPDWYAPHFDDSAWKPAYVIPERQIPWSYLEPRQTPMMREVERFPAKLVQLGEVIELPQRTLKETAVPERLMAEPLHRLEYAKVADADAVLHGDGRAAIMQSSPFDKDKGVRSPYLIVDFGRPVFGFPRMQLEGPGGAVVEMTYGPRLVAGRVPALSQGVRYGDHYTMRPGKQAWQVFEYKQFRYLQIVIRNAEKPVSVDSISLISYEYPAERKGAFECSDPVLTKLWEAGVDTTYLHMEDALVCDAVRERRVWTGDGAHGLYGIYAAFGDIAITDWFFRLISRGRLADGMLRMFYPGTDLGAVGLLRATSQTAFENPENIPQFALFYGLFVGEHYGYFGKRNLIDDLYPTLAGLAGWCERHADDSGLLYSLPNWNFTDWVENEMQGANLETNALYYKLLRDMAVMAADLGKAGDAEKWKTRAERVRESIRRLHWNPQRGLYADSVIDGKQSPIVTELSNGLALLFEIATSEQQPKIVHHLADPKAEIVRSSPLYFCYTLEGLIKAGAADVALTQMRDRYAPMMEDSDAPTIWEMWPDRWEMWPDWMKARYGGALAGYVHSGGVGPTWTLSKHVLGVYPIGPGFQSCRIEPPTAWLQWARGVFPSVRGDIKAEWKKESGRFVLDAALPEGLETQLVLPRNFKEDLRLTHNGKNYEIRAGDKSVAGLQLSDAKVSIKVTGGNHLLELVARKIQQ